MTTAARRVEIDFADNALVPLLYGEHDTYLVRLEHQLGVSLASRGNKLTISGPNEATQHAEAVLNALYERLETGQAVGPAEVDAAVRFARDLPGEEAAQAVRRQLSGAESTIVTKRRRITPRTPTQSAYIRALAECELVFGIGPAGTGKTYLAVAHAVSLLTGGKVDRIILSRPAVEAGERLGFLPGDLKEKVDPYLRPLYDALYDMLPGDQVARHLENGTIEVAPLAFMRGRTLAHAAVILDEAQNTSPVQMKMFLTRMGENSHMAITGDMSQIDLPRGVPSGLGEAIDILKDVEGVTFVRFTDRDVVRHPMVTRVVRAYQAAEQGELDLKR